MSELLEAADPGAHGADAGRLALARPRVRAGLGVVPLRRELAQLI